MDYHVWLKKFGIMRDGDYLGFSEESPDPDEFLPMMLDINIVKDSEYIWDKMNHDHSYIWSVFIDGANRVISNGFEPGAVGYYIGSEICKRKALKVRIKA